MFNKFKKAFKLSNWKRWIISSVSLISIVLAITLGSIYGVSNNRPTTDYQKGAELVVKVTNPDDTLDVIKRQTEQRLNQDSTGNSLYEVTLNTENFLTIKGTNVDTDAKMQIFKNLVSSKNAPIVTPLVTKFDAQGNPIKLPFQFSNATLSSGTITLEIVGTTIELGDILIWSNLPGLLELAVTKYNDEWTSANVNRDPYKFLFIDGITEDVTDGPKAILKTKEFGGFDATDYLISKNIQPEGGKYTGPITLDFAFAPKITLAQKEKIFYNLDFAVSSYGLNLETYNFIKPSLGNNAYQFLMIAAITSFSFIAIFIMVNYGLLGVLATICAALLVFLGLLMITVFRGEYSAESIAALILAVGLSLDFNIIYFERFKKELKLGNSLQKSLKKANKLTFKSSLTKALALIITSIIIYVIGSFLLGTFVSITLIMSILIMIVMFIAIRVFTNLIIGTKVFDDKNHLFGIYKFMNKKKTINTNQLSSDDEHLVKSNLDEIENLVELEKVGLENEENPNQVDLVKNNKVVLAKRISIFFLGIFAATGTILFTIFTSLGSSWENGMNASGSLIGPRIVRITNSLSLSNAELTKEFLKTKLGVDDSEVSLVLTDITNNKYGLEISTNKVIETQKLLEIQNDGFNLIDYEILSKVANDAILHVFYIALACILVMGIFVLIRSDWSYALAMAITLFISLILFTLLFTLQIFTFNSFFVFGMIAAILIAVSNNITVLFRIKEKLSNRKLEELTKSEIKEIASESVKDSMKRLLISNGLMLIILLTFTFIIGAANLMFTIPVAIFIGLSLIVSTVITPFFFSIFKAFRCKRKRDKILNQYWEIQIIEEQTFLGINDIK